MTLKEAQEKGKTAKTEPAQVCFNCAHYNSRRNRFKCPVAGAVVYGSEQRTCFEKGRITQAFKELAAAAKGAYDQQASNDQAH